MMKCKYAGDQEDEYCKNCDGCEVMFDGKSIPATECSGYEEGTEDITKKETNDTTTTHCSTPNLSENKEDNKTTTKDEKSLNKENKQPRGYTSELRFMSGGSVEKNGVWYKFECCETRVLEPNLSEEQVAEEREKLWATVNNEVDAQISDVLNL